jgi:hypothetical protein
MRLPFFPQGNLEAVLVVLSGRGRLKHANHYTNESGN